MTTPIKSHGLPISARSRNGNNCYPLVSRRFARHWRTRHPRIRQRSAAWTRTSGSFDGEVSTRRTEPPIYTQHHSSSARCPKPEKQRSSQESIAPERGIPRHLGGETSDRPAQDPNEDVGIPGTCSNGCPALVASVYKAAHVVLFKARARFTRPRYADAVLSSDRGSAVQTNVTRRGLANRPRVPPARMPSARLFAHQFLPVLFTWFVSRVPYCSCFSVRATPMREALFLTRATSPTSRVMPVRSAGRLRRSKPAHPNCLWLPAPFMPAMMRVPPYPLARDDRGANSNASLAAF